MNQQAEPKTKRRIPWALFAIIIAFAAVLAYSRYAPANDVAWAADVAAARAKAAESGKPVLMEFSATWCPACNAVKRNVWPDKRVSGFVNDRSVPLAIDVDKNQALSAQYNINAIPAFVLTDAGGRELVRAEGYLDADQVIALVKSAEQKLIVVPDKQ